VADFANVRLTVRLLSGSLLAKLVVEPTTIVADLKMKIEEAAQLPSGRVVRWLAWNATELPDDSSLQELGLSRGELVAVCADALVGDFEVYQPGCPTCDYNSQMQSVQLFADGTALIQFSPYESSRKFRYKLGELTDAGRQLEFIDDEAELAVMEPAVYTGILHVSATNPIHRRVKIPQLDIDVEDLRYLKQKGKTALEEKMNFLFAYYEGGYDSLRNFQNPSAISYSEEEVWEAWTSARHRWEDIQKEEYMFDSMETYDEFANKTHTAKLTKRKQKRAFGKKCKRDVLRWGRPKMT